MEWSSIAPTAITGIVGLAGIVGSIMAARLTSRSASRDLQLSINAEDKRASTSERRRIYAAFNAAIEGLWIVATSSEDFTSDPGRSHYNQAMTLLWSNYYEVSLVASERVSALALGVTEIMTKMASDLRTNRDEYLRQNRGNYEPPGFNKKRDRLITEMRDDLGGKILVTEHAQLPYLPLNRTDRTLQSYGHKCISLRHATCSHRQNRSSRTL